jgi:hypothetical protein
MIRKISQPKVCLTGLTAIAVFLGANSALAKPSSIEDIQPISSSVSTVEVLPPAQTVSGLSRSEIGNPSAQDMEVSVEDNNRSVASVEPALQGSLPEATPATNNNRSNQVAQVVVDPGRSTRSGPSYLGIAGNIGLGGDSSLGDSGFAVISKIGLTRTLSARPSVVIGNNDPTIVLPVTIDFPISSVLSTGELNLEAAPYVGGGIAISTGGDSLVRPVISAGIDVPIASRVTATAGVNFAFFDSTEIGLILGAGYRF